jgi:hypothetical protein
MPIGLNARKSSLLFNNAIRLMKIWINVFNVIVLQWNKAYQIKQEYVSSLESTKTTEKYLNSETTCGLEKPQNNCLGLQQVMRHFFEWVISLKTFFVGNNLSFLGVSYLVPL